MGDYILALDPSFRHTGWVVIEILADCERVADVGVIVTKKIDAKARCYASDDNHRCAQLIAKGIQYILAHWDIELICAEAQVGSKNSRAAQLMGMAWGVVSGLAHVRAIPLIQAQPMAVKQLLTGKRKASKDDIRRAVCDRYSGMAELIDQIRPPSLHEHVYDAIAVAVACFDSTEIATLRRAVRQRAEEKEC